MREPTEEECALWAQLKELDKHILKIDNVPRVSRDFEEAETGDWLCLCAKMWSDVKGQAAYVETWYDPILLQDGDLNVAEILYSSPTMGIKTALEYMERDLE